MDTPSQPFRLWRGLKATATQLAYVSVGILQDAVERIGGQTREDLYSQISRLRGVINELLIENERLRHALGEVPAGIELLEEWESLSQSWPDPYEKFFQ